MISSNGIFQARLSSPRGRGGADLTETDIVNAGKQSAVPGVSNYSDHLPAFNDKCFCNVKPGNEKPARSDPDGHSKQERRSRSA